MPIAPSRLKDKGKEGELGGRSQGWSSAAPPGPRGRVRTKKPLKKKQRERGLKGRQKEGCGMARRKSVSGFKRYARKCRGKKKKKKKEKKKPKKKKLLNRVWPVRLRDNPPRTSGGVIKKNRLQRSVGGKVEVRPPAPSGTRSIVWWEVAALPSARRGKRRGGGRRPAIRPTTAISRGIPRR